MIPPFRDRQLIDLKKPSWIRVLQYHISKPLIRLLQKKGASSHDAERHDSGESKYILLWMGDRCFTWKHGLQHDIDSNVIFYMLGGRVFTSESNFCTTLQNGRWAGLGLWRGEDCMHLFDQTVWVEMRLGCDILVRDVVFCQPRYLWVASNGLCKKILPSCLPYDLVSCSSSGCEAGY